MRKQLDREVMRNIELIVTLSDGEFTVEMSLNLNVEDVNDNIPAFDVYPPVYRVSFSFYCFDKENFAIVFLINFLMDF